MQKKVCPNGHVYDPSIYGDQCPMCPTEGNVPIGSGTQVEAQMGCPKTQFGDNLSQFSYDGHTRIAAPKPVENWNIPPQMPLGGDIPTGDVSGATRVRPQEKEPAGAVNASGHTVIRRPGRGGATQSATGRKLVGFLVTYNRDPLGKAYNLYEGRNYIGRDQSCDICVNDDTQMSGRHMSILYRNVDDKFKFRDEQSSNGTFVNKELLDDGELHNYDIIRVGSTLFIFIAIPKVG